MTIERPQVHQLRDEGIDGLRALAILLVVLYHFTFRWTATQLHFDAPVVGVPFGHLGVQLFFVISGYCIALTAQRAPSAGVFWVRRLSRIIPAFIACVLITAVATRLLYPIRPPAGWDVVAGDLLWFTLFADRPQLVDGAYWTLIVEMKFYLYFAALLAVFRSVSRAAAAFFLIVCLGAAVVLFHSWLHLPSRASALFSQTILLYPYGIFFTLGLSIRLTKNRVVHGGLAVVALAASYSSARHALEAGVLAGLLIAAILILPRRDIKLPRPLVYIGLISYPLYLLHQDIGVALIRTMAPWSPSPYASIIISMAVVTALAALVSATVEHRFRRQIEGAIFLVAARIAKLFRPPQAAEAPSGTQP